MATEKNIYYKRDFALNIVNTGDWETAFEVKLWTTKASKGLVVSYDGETYDGCTTGTDVDGNVTLVVPMEGLVDTYGQGLGTLKMQLTQLVEDETFEDGYENRVYPPVDVVHQDDEGNEYYIVLGLTDDDLSDDE